MGRKLRVWGLYGWNTKKSLRSTVPDYATNVTQDSSNSDSIYQKESIPQQ